MEYRRYGKFRLGDYAFYFFLVGFLSVLTLICFFFTEERILCLLPTVFTAVLLGRFLWCHGETFFITPAAIVVKKYGKTEKIPLPEKITLVVSYASPSTMIGQARSYGFTHGDVLKDQYAVTILKTASMEKVKEILRIFPGQKHTSCTISSICPGKYYVYSFVCTDDMLSKITREFECTIVMPHSLQKVIFANLHGSMVHIDYSY